MQWKTLLPAHIQRVKEKERAEERKGEGGRREGGRDEEGMRDIDKSPPH